ncbi:cobalamin biosynthesis protein [Microvirga sp. HBU67558]|uniref:adenosylcobinamide-phosphate synthase CbiB n=1 Tax=Microvirga TaxID=186650 RepID=UPI001B3604A3|nr:MULTISPECIES: adenosylcobinamide-phosphate synthase CbiB [unclassified Microvirga]MBQ0823823.1 cobalamin biosynthesis protein [Microvirga sp. HBU67558]
MILSCSLITLSLALAAEAAFGYPSRLYTWIGHPVTWIGRLIKGLDRGLNRERWSFGRRRAAGVLALLLLLGITGSVAWMLQEALLPVGPAGLAILAVLAGTLIAQRSLHEHVAAVSQGLRESGLDGGRRAVSMIVGRNPQSLDEAGVARAAIESLAENFSDGIVAPAFWLGLGGLPGAALYKATNTADSMIGHRTPRHEAFGWAAARFDDLVNLPASRLTALLVIVAAALHRGASARNAWRAVRRDARQHRSPNAGWPEAAMAGALGLRLAGPRVYGNVLVEDRWMGDGRAEARAHDIERALALYRTACALLFGLATGSALVAWLTAR